MPKESGGMVLVVAKPKNLALLLLAKSNWSLLNDDSAPWVRVLKVKYVTLRV